MRVFSHRVTTLPTCWQLQQARPVCCIRLTTGPLEAGSWFTGEGSAARIAVWEPCSGMSVSRLCSCILSGSSRSLQTLSNLVVLGCLQCWTVAPDGQTHRAVHAAEKADNRCAMQPFFLRQSSQLLHLVRGFPAMGAADTCG